MYKLFIGLLFINLLLNNPALGQQNMIKFELSKSKPIAELPELGLKIILKELQEPISSRWPHYKTVIYIQGKETEKSYSLTFNNIYGQSNHYKIWNNFLIDMDIEQGIAKFTIQPASNIIPDGDNILSAKISKTSNYNKSISLATLKAILKTGTLTDQPRAFLSGVGPIYKGNIQCDTQSYQISFYLNGHGILQNDRGKCYEFTFDRKGLDEQEDDKNAKSDDFDSLQTRRFVLSKTSPSVKITASGLTISLVHLNNLVKDEKTILGQTAILMQQDKEKQLIEFNRYSDSTYLTDNTYQIWKNWVMTLRNIGMDEVIFDLDHIKNIIPKPEEITSVDIHGNSANTIINFIDENNPTLSLEKFREVMRTAKLTDEDIVNRWHFGPLGSGSFICNSEKYNIALFIGGLGILNKGELYSTKGGKFKRRGYYFMFDLSKK